MNNQEARELLSKPGAIAEAVYINGRWVGVCISAHNPGYYNELRYLVDKGIRERNGLPDTAVITRLTIPAIELWAFHNSLTHGPAAN